MNLNKGVDNLSVGQLSNNTQDAVRFVGREVIARGDSINFDGTTAAPVKYHMPYGVVTSTVSVYDQHGNLVHQEEANPAPGASQFEWDGRDSEGRVVRPANIELPLRLMMKVRIPCRWIPLSAVKWKVCVLITASLNFWLAVVD